MDAPDRLSSRLVFNGKRSTKQLGLVSEAAVLHLFAKAGYVVSLPFGENAPYDMIVEDGEGRLSRIQVKTGRLRDGCVRFNAVSVHAHRNAAAKRYHGKIDAFAVYCPENGKFYIVPIDDPVAKASIGWLRIAPARNNMRAKIHWADRYAVRPGKESPALFDAGLMGTGAVGGD